MNIEQMNPEVSMRQHRRHHGSDRRSLPAPSSTAMLKTTHATNMTTTRAPAKSKDSDKPQLKAHQKQDKRREGSLHYANVTPGTDSTPSTNSVLRQHGKGGSRGSSNSSNNRKSSDSRRRSAPGGLLKGAGGQSKGPGGRRKASDDMML